MWWQGSGIPYRSSQSLFPGRRQWDCFREGGSEKVSGFGNYSSKAFLILFFSGKPEMWGTRDKSLHWCVRLLRTCCRFAAAVEADAKGCLLEGRDENSGEGFQVNVDVECCEVPTSMIDDAYWCSLLTRVASVRRSLPECDVQHAWLNCMERGSIHCDTLPEGEFFQVLLNLV